MSEKNYEYESYIDKVQCYICKGQFRADNSHINLICKLCQSKEKKELMGEFIEDWKKEIEYIKTINNYQDFAGELKQCIWVKTLEEQINNHIIKKWEAKLK